MSSITPSTLESTEKEGKDDIDHRRRPRPPLELGWTQINRRSTTTKRPRPSTSTTAAASISTPSALTGVGGRVDDDVVNHDDDDDDNNNNNNNRMEDDAKDDNDDDDDWLWSCCKDPNCNNRSGSGTVGHLEQLFLDNVRQQQDRTASTTTTKTAKTETPRNRVVNGQAIFLLHEANPDWFQGYFFPSSNNNDDGNNRASSVTMMGMMSHRRGRGNNNKPWGLLAQQLELDDCLQCAEGGYRQIKLTVYPHYNNKNNQLIDGPPITLKKRKKTKMLFGEIEWTGGDMMYLQSPYVRMRTERLITGPKVIPFVQEIFGSLVRQLQQRQQEQEQQESKDNDETATMREIHDDSNNYSKEPAVMELLPDCAVVIGDMQLILSLKDDDDDDSDDNE